MCLQKGTVGQVGSRGPSAAVPGQRGPEGWKDCFGCRAGLNLLPRRCVILCLPIKWQAINDKTNSLIKINCSMSFRHAGFEA